MAPTLRWGTVTAVTQRLDELIRCTVDGAECMAYPRQTGDVEVGDTVLVNTQAKDLEPRRNIPAEIQDAMAEFGADLFTRDSAGVANFTADYDRKQLNDSDFLIRSCLNLAQNDR